MPSYTVRYHKIDKPHITGNKSMSGKDIEDIKTKFNKSGHAKTDAIFEIKLGSKVVWTA